MREYGNIVTMENPIVTKKFQSEEHRYVTKVRY